MKMEATKIERCNLLYWWDSQLFWEKSKQKFLFMMKIPETTTSFCSNMFNKLNRFHQKRKWVNSVRKQDLCVLSKLDNISWQEMLVNLNKQWLVANTLFLEMIELLNRQGNMRIGPVLEVTTSFQLFKYGIEIRIESVNKDNSHSWVRISYRTVKYLVDSIQDNIEIPADPQEEQIPQTSTSVVAARSKAKAKPQSRILVGTTATIPIHERRWIDIEPSK